MQLQWHNNVTASALYAAAAWASGRQLTDQGLANVIEAPLSRLSAALVPAKLAAADMLKAAIPLSPRHATADGLVRASLSSLGHDAVDPPLVGELVAAIDELMSAMFRASPDTGQQLSLRTVPLREAWDARGPGLWRALRQTAGSDMAAGVVADVLCVQPVLGGGGDAFPSQQTVAVEAVLANEHFQLPEVVRLGWLLAQLFFHPDVSDIRHSRLDLVTAVLKAAEEVELARCDAPTIRLALDAWRLGDDTAQRE